MTDASFKCWQSIANRLLDVSYRRQLLDAEKAQAGKTLVVMRRKWNGTLAKLTGEKRFATV